MSAITAALVKDLRDKTGAGMMDCKKALVESSGDIEKAIENLRKSGIAKAAKKAGRVTTEGKVVSLISETGAAMLEVLCETDFVAKNDQFTQFCNKLVKKIIETYEEVGDLSERVSSDEKDALTNLVSKVGENIQIRRVVRWQPEGKCTTYIHAGGKIGVLLDVLGENNNQFLMDLCMHIAAFNPLYVTDKDVPKAVIDKEKEIAAALPEMKGKPSEIVDRILEGKIKKWFTEHCLLKQSWIRDDKITVEKALSTSASISKFLRWQIGEEI